MTRLIMKGIETREGISFKLKEDDKITYKNVPFMNWFYVDEDFDTTHFNSMFGQVTELSNHGKYTKIILKNNFMRAKIREYFDELNIPTYEADINAVKRFLINNQNIELNTSKIPFLFIDIETDDRYPLLKDDNGKVIANSCILSFCAVDFEGKEFVLINKGDEPSLGEFELLTKITEVLKDYGLICGWNSKFFDDPFIEQRLKYHGIKFNMDYFNKLDFLEVYKKNTRHSLKSYKLESVAQYELKEGKADQLKGHGEVYKRWKTDKEGLLSYNLQDTRLLKKMNDKLGFLTIHMNIAEISHCFIRDTLYAGDFGDYLVMNECHNRNLIMKSKPNKEQKEKLKWQAMKIGGGYTTCFHPGFYEEAKVWDFASAYPEVIKTWNISFDTKLEEKEEGCIMTPTNESDGRFHPNRYFKREQGVIPCIVQGLLNTRNKIRFSETYKRVKKETPANEFKIHPLYLQQYSYKVAANSIFGLVAFSDMRFYDYDLGDSITSTVRSMLQALFKKLEEWSCKVLGGDTDSTFVETKDSPYTTQQIDDMIKVFLDEYIAKFNIIEHSIFFKYERDMKPFLFVMKKNYAYKEEGSIVIKGLEAIKSSTNTLAAKMQEELINDIMNLSLKREEWDVKVPELRNKCFNGDLDKEHLLMVKALTKHPSKYEGYIMDKKTKKPKVKRDGTLQMKSVPAHVKLARELMEKDESLTIGAKIQYVVMGQKPIQAHNFETWTKEDGYDKSYYWERLALPIMKILYAYDKEYFSSFDWRMRESKIKKQLDKWGGI